MLNKQDKIFIFILVTVTLAIYANSFGNELIWDNYFEIINNQYVHNFEISNFFTKSLFAGSGEHDGFYRPIALISFALDYKMWGLNPFGYHLTNVILHILTAVVIYLLFSLLQSSRPVAFLTALLIAVHPFNIEDVTYISGRNDLLATLFILVTLFLFSLSFFKKEHSRIYYLLSLFSFTIAILSKESAIVTPALVVLVYLAFIRSRFGNERLSLIKIIPFFAISIGYLMLRLSVLNFGMDIAGESSGIFSRSLSFLKSLLIYWRIIFVPYDTHFRLEQQLSFENWEIILSCLILVAIGWLSIKYLKKGSCLLFFGFSWFFISLVPVSGIFFSVKYALGERWLRLASIGIFFIISCGLEKFFSQERKKIVNNLLILILFIYIGWLAVIVIRTNPLWKNQITYFEYLLKIYPEDFETHLNLGVAYDEKGRDDDAFREYKKTLELNPDVFNIHANLGGYYAEKKQFDLAIIEYKKAIVLNGSFTYAYQALAQIYVNQGQYEKAVSILKMLMQVVPTSWKPYSLLGDVYMMKKDYLKAKESFEKGLELDPGNENLEKKLKSLI